MKVKQKPLSFSLCAENIAYVEEEYGTRHRNRSHWMDDLLTHLRLKKEAPATQVAVVKKDKEPVKRFVPPTPLEVDAYMVEKGLNKPDEANKFCDHFESNGWKVGGKTKMVSWKAAVRTWLKNNDGNQARMYGKPAGKTSGNLSACEDFING